MRKSMNIEMAFRTADFLLFTFEFLLFTLHKPNIQLLNSNYDTF